MAINNRHELVFIYDSRFANPNGDPLENDELRMIHDKLYVTDVRLKRTIRDYWDQIGENVFVKEELKDNQDVKSIKDRLSDEGINDKKATKEDIQKFKEKFVDVRAFGSAILTKITGPVQFNFGESMHDVDQVRVQGTTVFSSGESKGQGTFTEMFVVPYSIIAFHGIVNEKASSSTNFEEEDFNSLKNGLWDGTKNLLTRSKFEQMPRILVDVKFKEGVNTHIGELDKYIKFVPNNKIRDSKALNDISKGYFEFGEFVERVEDYKDKIDSIDIKIDKRASIQNLESQEIDLRVEKV
ncbi:type I-B CRISPR-associated protein Cas7/Csh2 [Candidatus Absconditicoccus praedator]|uniref:type I-B CRISPR-associated protein Cas7/Csh2 n=1 Tax=Candidatus Absconditicoccus praedator TaxID=2735562 RepID=UPI001E44400E|nr:type I-B CRISPR-associated protein Cas7/Csh2 [Candidatus Absconditicoccus praedator]UFX82687.1 type I-B CRISPR-associated protein Cas7/Csh2 [Candidatus Absconditicoccus praedator]